MWPFTTTLRTPKPPNSWNNCAPRDDERWRRQLDLVGLAATGALDQAHRGERDVHEVELVGEDVRGVAVHEAARIMAAAGADEILVSDLTRALAGAAGLRFEDRGTHELKGLDGEWRLAAYVPEERAS